MLVSRRAETAYLYVFSVPGGPTKIGHAMSVERRQKAIERESGKKVIVTGNWPVGSGIALAVERYVHWLLREKHFRGEWFNASEEEVLAAVDRALNAEIDPCYPIPPVDEYGRGMKYGDHMATKYPAGTKAAVSRLLNQGEGPADFVREAVAREIKRRSRLLEKGLHEDG